MDGSKSPAIELSVQDVHKSFDDDVVLRGVDLTVFRGEIVAIVGGSGCGKTVLLELLTGQLSPDRGRILIAEHERDGAALVDIARLDEDGMQMVRRRWAIVFQRNALFSGTVYDNLGLWLREVHGLAEPEILRRARAALTAVGLDPGEILDQDRDELSGGMAKRVAVARAIALDPGLIFYDEPTTGLDPHHLARIHDLIFDVHHQPHGGGTPRTTVVITHDRDLLRRVRPRVVMLHDGRVFFDGAYRAFAKSDSPIVRPYFARMPVLQLRKRPRGT
jgi:phospholipid/cholesterol/gamma-HCH transport system ATP-binding protein